MPSSSPTPIRRPPATALPRAPVWLPWLLAPAFLLLPIGGCGAVAALRRPAAVTTETARAPLPGPVAPVTTVATMAPATR